MKTFAVPEDAYNNKSSPWKRLRAHCSVVIQHTLSWTSRNTVMLKKFQNFQPWNSRNTVMRKIPKIPEILASMARPGADSIKFLTFLSIAVFREFWGCEKLFLSITVFRGLLNLSIHTAENTHELTTMTERVHEQANKSLQKLLSATTKRAKLHGCLQQMPKFGEWRAYSTRSWVNRSAPCTKLGCECESFLTAGRHV